jgi:hypothetical protein
MSQATTEPLHERVESDDKLTGDEKETTITMCGTDKQFNIFSAKATVVRSLLQHDNFDTTWVSGLSNDDYVRVESRQEASELLDVVYGIKGKMPVGCLSVKSKPRTKNRQSDVVTHETVSSDVWDDD